MTRLRDDAVDRLAEHAAGGLAEAIDDYVVSHPLAFGCTHGLHEEEHVEIRQRLHVALRPVIAGLEIEGNHRG